MSLRKPPRRTPVLLASKRRNALKYTRPHTSSGQCRIVLNPEPQRHRGTEKIAESKPECAGKKRTCPHVSPIPELVERVTGVAKLWLRQNRGPKGGPEATLGDASIATAMVSRDGDLTNKAGMFNKTRGLSGCILTGCSLNCSSGWPAWPGLSLGENRRAKGKSRAKECTPCSTVDWTHYEFDRAWVRVGETLRVLKAASKPALSETTKGRRSSRLACSEQSAQHPQGSCI
jgi:hypothetical protein